MEQQKYQVKKPTLLRELDGEFLYNPFGCN